MSASDLDWGCAFAAQTDADWRAFVALSRVDGIALCQSLHFLQMTAEKLCKANLYLSGQVPANLTTSHAHISKRLPHVLRETARRLGRPLPNEWYRRQFDHFAREIELLAPSVDDAGRRPDNCEYPWENTRGTVIVPAEFEFPELDIVTNAAGQELLRLIPRAIEQMLAQCQTEGS